MPVNQDDVRDAYRWLLGREASEAEARVWLGAESPLALRRAFLSSAEFNASTLLQRRPGAPLLPGNNEIEWKADDRSEEKLTAHIQETWDQLGRESPHWSVLSADRFLPNKISDNSPEFYESGKVELKLISNILTNNVIDSCAIKTVVEYGCGVGRVTPYLAAEFPRIIAIDISESHLALAKQQCIGLENVSFVLARMPEFGMEESIDLWFSRIVLQHNPPPIIARILATAFSKLTLGGLAIFQVTTWGADYRFRLGEYLESCPLEPKIEIHCLPQWAIFELAERARCVPVEVRTDDAMGPPSAWSSHLFLFRKKSR